MDLLDQSVLPQSSSHLLLLKYLIGLTYILFLPYMSILFGTLVYSIYFKRKAYKSGKGIYRKFSKELLDLILSNKGVSFAFGVLPLIIFIFGYTQIFHLTGSGIPFYLIITLFLFILALFLIYTFKYSFHLNDLFCYANDNIKEQKPDSGFYDEITEYNKNTSRISNKSGKYGLILLTASTLIFTGIMQLASNPSGWDNSTTFLGMIFSLSTFLNYLQFLTASFAFTSAFILYWFNRNEEYGDINDRTHFKNIILKTGLISGIILPVLIIITTLNRPVLSLSFNYFITVLLIMFLLIGICCLFFIIIRESNFEFSTYLIILFIFLFSLLAVQDQLAIHASSRIHSAILAADYDVYELKVKEELGIDTKPINGADIYNGRCIACHRFDVKIVGPPYNQTLPKYEGKKDELVKFIMNPIKINPDYPAMPNQGLKPKEADAVADYILNTYKKKGN